MKIVRKNQAERFQNGEHCVAFEYALGDAEINGAVIELTGRYPHEKRAMNVECKELIHVVDGSGTLVVEGKETRLEAGDVVSIDPGEKYFFDGRLTIFIASAPAWRPDQYKEVD